MCYDKMEIITSGDEKLIYSPVKLNCNFENVIALRATGTVGSVDYLSIWDDKFRVSWNEYKMKKDTSLHVNLPGVQSLALAFTLKNEFHYEIEGLPHGVSLKNQFNVIYLPTINTQYHFKKDREYIVFSVEFPIDYLKVLNKPIPIVTEFVKNFDNQRAALIARHLPITAEMMVIVHDFLNFRYTGLYKKMFLEAKAIDLIRLALDQLSLKRTQFKSNFRIEDAEIIYRAHDYLMENIARYSSIMTVARKVGINQSKLKEGFKELYGVTIFQFVREQRMLKAHKLLLETDYSVKTVALLVGYKSVPNFTVAFRKRFGCLPSDLKR